VGSNDREARVSEAWPAAGPLRGRPTAAFIPSTRTFLYSIDDWRAKPSDGQARLPQSGGHARLRNAPLATRAGSPTLRGSGRTPAERAPPHLAREAKARRAAGRIARRGRGDSGFAPGCTSWPPKLPGSDTVVVARSLKEVEARAAVGLRATAVVATPSSGERVPSPLPSARSRRNRDRRAAGPERARGCSASWQQCRRQTDPKQAIDNYSRRYESQPAVGISWTDGVQQGDDVLRDCDGDAGSGCRQHGI
jgi:hypothetical protein